MSQERTPTLFGKAARWWRMQKAQAELFGMPDYLLKDIGLGRCEIGSAVRGRSHLRRSI